jgi:type VI protein secretion system component Hcp
MAQAYVVFVPYSGAPLVSESTVDRIDDPFVAPSPVATAGALFEIDRWSTDVEQMLNIGSQSSGAGAGRVTFNPFSITRKVDKASPYLLLAACSGTPFEFVDLLVLRPGDPDRRVLVAWRFGLVAVKTLAWFSDDDVPTETITFEYGSLTVGYAAQNPDGMVEPMVIAGWNWVRNVEMN